MSTYSLSDKRPCKNIGAAPPTQKKYRDEDGEIIVEKLNPMRCKMKMVSPNGGVAYVSLATGWEIRTIHERDNQYGAQLLAEKRAAGWLPFRSCPLAQPGVQLRKGEKPCGGGSDEKCCEHMLRLINKRRHRYHKQQLQYAQQMEKQTREGRLADIAEKLAELAAQNVVPDK